MHVTPSQLPPLGLPQRESQTESMCQNQRACFEKEQLCNPLSPAMLFLIEAKVPAEPRAGRSHTVAESANVHCLMRVD